MIQGNILRWLWFTAVMAPSVWGLNTTQAASPLHSTTSQFTIPVYYFHWGPLDSALKSCEKDGAQVLGLQWLASGEGMPLVLALEPPLLWFRNDLTSNTTQSVHESQIQCWDLTNYTNPMLLHNSDACATLCRKLLTGIPFATGSVSSPVFYVRHHTEYFDARVFCKQNGADLLTADWVSDSANSRLLRSFGATRFWVKQDEYGIQCQDLTNSTKLNSRAVCTTACLTHWPRSLTTLETVFSSIVFAINFSSMLVFACIWGWHVWQNDGHLGGIWDRIRINELAAMLAIIGSTFSQNAAYQHAEPITALLGFVMNLALSVRSWNLFGSSMRTLYVKWNGDEPALNHDFLFRHQIHYWDLIGFFAPSVALCCNYYGASEYTDVFGYQLLSASAVTDATHLFLRFAKSRPVLLLSLIV